jgi:hypothetical protein
LTWRNSQAVAQIPAQTQHNKLTLEMAPLENGWRIDGHVCLRWFAVSGLTFPTQSLLRQSRTSSQSWMGCGKYPGVLIEIAV